MSHVSTFKEYLERQFSIMLPKEVALQEQENVIRVFSKTAMMMRPSGYMGFVAGKVSTNGIEVKGEFIQLFGHLARKNVIVLADNAAASDFVHLDVLQCPGAGAGQKIVRFGRHTLGIARASGDSLKPEFIGKGRRRAENRINP